MKISLYRYIAGQNPKAAHELLIKEGYKNMPKDKNTISIGLADLVNKGGEKALQKLAEIHPDKMLFDEKSPAFTKEKNCCGADSHWENATGSTPTGKFKLTPNTINVMIISGVALFAITSIVILIKKTK